MASITTTDALSVAFAEKLATYGLTSATQTDANLVVQAFIDTIGCILVGRPEDAVRIVSKIFGQSPGKSLIIGSGSKRTTSLDATMINGVASHALDYDDMVDGSHPSVTIVPALLALGEELGSSGPEILDAYIAGFETHQRFLLTLFPHHYNNGWHPTSTIGTFASAAACARLMHLTVPQTATALSLAASMASGIKANFGSMGKPFHAGHCGRNGFLAACIAKEGFTANLNALEHKAGFFQAYDGLENVNVSALLHEWPRQLAISRGPWALKPYPCCGSTHMAIRAALTLRKNHAESFDVNHIKSITITVHPERIPHTNNPSPRTGLQAKFSIQYVTARALVSGAVRLGDFEGDAYAEPAIQRLLAMTSVEARPPSTCRNISEICAGAIAVTLEGGTVLRAEVEGFLGPGSKAPLTVEELWDKFSDCASRTLKGEACRRLFDLLLDLPGQRDLGAIVGAMEGVR